MRIFLMCIGFGVLLWSCHGDDGERNGQPSQKAGPPAVVKGEELFQVNCAQCHQPKEDFVGPSLAGVETRWKSKELLYAFVRNSREVIARDEYAAALFKKWNGSVMLPFPNLPDEDIAAILAYCNTAQ